MIKLEKLLFIFFGIAFIGCIQSKERDADTDTANQVKKLPIVEHQLSKEEVIVQDLIREVLEWANSENSIDLFPVIADDKNEIYIGFDHDRLKQNEKDLANTNLFSRAFIANYGQIIKKLDNKLKSKGFNQGPWYVGEQPPFSFGGQLNPWCLCQDNMNWDLVEIEKVTATQYTWKWGGLNKDADESWKKFRYKFEISKEDGQWKVSSLEGFKIDEL